MVEGKPQNSGVVIFSNVQQVSVFSTQGLRLTIIIVGKYIFLIIMVRLPYPTVHERWS